MTDQVLDLHLHGTLIAQLARNPVGRCTLHFVQAYQDQVNRPVLSQSFEDRPKNSVRGKGQALPVFLANLVPEGALRALLGQSLGIDSADEFALLEALGNDLPGAVVVARSNEIGAEGLDSSTDEEGGGNGSQNPGEDPTGLRFSLAGVQLKFSVLRQGERLALPAHGSEGEWIVKLESKEYEHLVENEFSMMEWARAAGFDVPECKIINYELLDPRIQKQMEPGSRVFAIRRFDRTTDGRVHQEDFAQVAAQRPQHKYDHVTYEALANLALNALNQEAYDELVRRLALMLAMGNCDAHLKNWALIYPDKITPQLAPLYDQVSTIAWPVVSRDLGLKFSGQRSLARVGMGSFHHLAKTCGVSVDRTQNIVNGTVHRLAEAWREVRGQLPLIPPHASILQDHWNRMSLLSEGRNPFE